LGSRHWTDGLARRPNNLDTLFDLTVTFDDLAWVIAQWPNKLAVKGIQPFKDAKSVVDLGVDGIVLSNHGGRQLDRAPVPFHLLPSVARELGDDTEILVDTGIMSGADIVAASRSALGSPCRTGLFPLITGQIRRLSPRRVAIVSHSRCANPVLVRV
jgi:isopentenyl diphosphate isomerase/L-lactate dehydrogenase-like FMN-dependent dehydrogenase